MMGQEKERERKENGNLIKHEKKEKETLKERHIHINTKEIKNKF